MFYQIIKILQDYIEKLDPNTSELIYHTLLFIYYNLWLVLFLFVYLKIKLKNLKQNKIICK